MGGRASKRRDILTKAIIARSCVCCHAVIAGGDWCVRLERDRGVICGRCAEREGKEVQRRNGGIG